MIESPTETSRQDSYLEWRQRLAAKQAAWREPTETAVPRSSQWDPAALFAKDEPAPPAPDDADLQTIDLQTIDLRADPPAAASSTTDVPAPADPPSRHDPSEAPASAPATPATPTQAQTRRGAAPEDTPRAAKAPAPRAQAPRARPEPPLDRQAHFDSVMARLERSAARPAPTVKPIADALQELNRRRLDGLITDDEFKARKAELFGRPLSP